MEQKNDKAREKAQEIFRGQEQARRRFDTFRNRGIDRTLRERKRAFIENAERGFNSERCPIGNFISN